MKKNPKKTNKTSFFLGVLSVPAITAIVILICMFMGFHPKSTGEHQEKNALKDTINIAAYFKDGNIYYVNGNEKTLVAENCYDVSSDSPVYTADYGISKTTGKIIYLADGKLYSFENGITTLIASNVTSWKTSDSMNAVVFTTPWQENIDSTLSTLYLYKDGIITPVDQGITTSSVRFSQDGSCFYAEKPNVFPQIRSKLIKYDLTGKSKIVSACSMPVMWLSDDGSTVITGESADDSLYTYVIYGNNFKKKIQINNVYYPSVSEDKSVAYLLCNYNEESKQGQLVALDLHSLKQKELAKEVSFFSIDSVTDSSKGVVYSVLTDSDNGLYSIYFCDIHGKSVRLIRNTDEDSIYSVAINTKSNDGYIWAPGKTRTDCAIYYVKIKNGKLESTKLASGYVDGLVYYEKTNSATFIKNPSSDKCQLFSANTTETKLLTDCCGANYNSGTQNFTSLSVLSNNNDKILMFNSVQVGDTEADIYGNLFLQTEDGESIKLGEDISSSYMSSPIANGDLTNIYFCLRKSSTLFDLYFYDGTNVSLLEENINGITEVY